MSVRSLGTPPPLFQPDCFREVGNSCRDIARWCPHALAPHMRIVLTYNPEAQPHILPCVTESSCSPVCPHLPHPHTCNPPSPPPTCPVTYCLILVVPITISKWINVAFSCQFPLFSSHCHAYTLANQCETHSPSAITHSTKVTLCETHSIALRSYLQKKRKQETRIHNRRVYFD